jgi:xanthine dehydrogenase accessory factor
MDSGTKSGMTHWQETAALAARAQQALAAGESVVWAVIVGIAGSTYRRAGAKLLIEADGRMSGNVSGGCLEADVREVALSLLASGEARQVHYDTSETEDRVWGMGLGCNGQVDLFLLPFQPAQAALFAGLRDALAGDAPVWLRWQLAAAAGDRLQVLARSDVAADGWQGAQFVERLEPPPRLLICGAGDDALPLARQAAAVGFRVVVADHRKAFLTEERFPDAVRRVALRPGPEAGAELGLDGRTLAVVKTHAATLDVEWVRCLMASPVPYVGLLGPRERRDEIRNGIDPAAQARLYGPVGLDLGGEGPEQVALSIVAECLAVWHGRAPRHLRDRRAAIHAPADEADLEEG